MASGRTWRVASIKQAREIKRALELVISSLRLHSGGKVYLEPTERGEDGGWLRDRKWEEYIENKPLLLKDASLELRALAWRCSDLASSFERQAKVAEQEREYRRAQDA